MPSSSPTLLIVLDGWGHRVETEDNAIAQANTPVWDSLWQNCPHSLISGSGLDVGLPDGQMGNSEVGHMNLGAGRVIQQDFTRINQSISDGTFQSSRTLCTTLEALRDSDRALHILGLLSPGGVHSHEDHIEALITLAREKQVARVYLHAFLDGRDVPPRSALPSLNKLQNHINESGAGGIASIIGRYYAMDRDNRWERVLPAYNLIVDGEAAFTAESPQAALEAAYNRDETDEFVQATAVNPNGIPTSIADGDAVIFMNFRADRARQITRAFTNPSFTDFERSRTPKLAKFITLTQYAADIDALTVFPKQSVHNSLGEYIAALGKAQLRLAETEKYAHVTFFFSGGREQEFPGEDRLLIPSPSVATYDLAPEMSANEVTEALVDAIYSDKYELVICNFANGDMVGHTGKLEASVKAVECLDRCLGKVEAALKASGAQCLITADHGNVEQLRDHQTEQDHTAHTSELVPLVYIGPKEIQLDPSGGVLSDVAPTLLDLMDLPQPSEMTGRTLICD